MFKTLYFEDDPDKLWAVSNVLERIGIQAEHAADLQSGFQKWEEATAAGRPYELILTDMQFPLTPAGPVCVDAGMRVIARLREKQDPVPVIVCSSVPYRVPDIHGCIWYSGLQPWQSDLLRLIQTVKQRKEEP